MRHDAKIISLLLLASGLLTIPAARAAVSEEPHAQVRTPNAPPANSAPPPATSHPSAPPSGRHDHRSNRHYDPHRSHIRVGGTIAWGGWWGPGWWGPGWGPYWYDPYWDRPYYWGATGSEVAAREGYGALDLDISPERAEVWVDGQRIGIADDFDGFPRYLWLPKGTYDVAFYLPGRRTLARQYSIYAGVVIDVEDRLEPGEAVRPDQLASTSHERRDERLRRDQEAAARAEAWGERVGPSSDAASGRSLDARQEPGRIRLRVDPADASVYLDGRFLGSGRELGNLRAGLLVDAGEHTLEVVRPGFEAERRQVEVSSGEEVAVELSLHEAPR